MKPLPVMACDPGTTRCGWARITLHREPARGFFAYDRGGHRELDRGWLRAELQQLRDEGGVFALETLIGGVFAGRNARPLLETRAMEQRILDIAEGAGWELPPKDCLPRVALIGGKLLKIPAGDYTYNKPKPRNGPPPKRPKKAMPLIWIEGWRGELCHDSTASDAQIALVVDEMVNGAAARIELLPKEQREHVRDSLGLAFVAAHRHLGLRVKLPPFLEAALWRLQQQEEQQRAAEKAAAKLGVKVPKKQTRLYSRATRREMGARSRAAHAARRATR